MEAIDPGTIIDDRYQLLALLGEGGMGAVFKANELGLEREVAIKILKTELRTNSESKARFQREGHILARLSHPHIVGFYRCGMHGPYPYIVMEYLRGASLKDTLAAKGRLSASQCLRIAIQVCTAMQSAHEAGIIHRDLKPNNILLLDGEENNVKVVDFGIAKLHDTSGALTGTGDLVGSLFYMSPEQCKGRTADERSDIYALGCVLYECLCGEPPLVADNPITILHKQVSETPLDFTRRNIKLPEGLESIVFKSFEKEPHHRYQSMSVLLQDLQLVEQGLLPIEARPQRMQRGDEQRNGQRRLVFSATLIAVVCLISMIACFRNSSTAIQNTPRDEITMHKETIARLERRFKTTNESDRPGTALLLVRSLSALADRYSVRKMIPEAEATLIREMELTPQVIGTTNTVWRPLVALSRLERMKATMESDPARKAALLQKSLSLLNKALASADQSSAPKLVISGLCTRSSLLAKMGRIKEARADFDKASRIALSATNLVGRFYFYDIAAEVNDEATVSSPGEALMVSDFLLQIAKYHVQLAHTSSGLSFQYKIPVPPKVETAEQAMNWLLRVYPVPPEDARQLADYQARITDIKQIKASLAAANQAATECSSDPKGRLFKLENH